MDTKTAQTLLETRLEQDDEWRSALCTYDDALKKSQSENSDLRVALKDIASALVDAAITLEAVDPNAPSLEMADIALGKHIRIVAPLIEEARNRKEG